MQNMYEKTVSDISGSKRTNGCKLLQKVCEAQKGVNYGKESVNVNYWKRVCAAQKGVN